MIRGVRRRLVRCAFAAVVAAPVPFTAAALVEAQVRAGAVDVTAVTGPVEIRRGGQLDWIPAVLGASLSERDEIRAFAGGSAELKLPDTSAFLVAENSRLVVTKLELDSQGLPRIMLFHLAVGKVRVALAQGAMASIQARQVIFAISTPNSVATAKAANMVVSYDPAQNLTVIASLPEAAGTPSELFSRDDSECERLSTVTGAGGLKRLDRDLFNRCMKSRGYAIQETK